MAGENVIPRSGTVLAPSDRHDKSDFAVVANDDRIINYKRRKRNKGLIIIALSCDPINGQCESQLRTPADKMAITDNESFADIVRFLIVACFEVGVDRTEQVTTRSVITTTVTSQADNVSAG